MKLKSWFIREIRECEIIPRGFGLAWVRNDRRIGVYLPFGAHIVVGLVRRIYYAALHGFWATAHDRAFESGRKAGREEGRRLQLQEDAGRLANVMDARRELTQLAVREFVSQIIKRSECDETLNP